MPEGSRNYIPKPEGWISFAELEKDSSRTPLSTVENEPATTLPIIDQNSAPSSSIASAKMTECDNDNSNPFNNDSAESSLSGDQPHCVELKKLTSASTSTPSGIDQEEAEHELESNSLEDALERAEPIPFDGMGMEMENGGHILETTGKIDQRKFNRGQAKRKSYE